MAYDDNIRISRWCVIEISSAIKFSKKLKWKEKEEGVCLLSKYLFSKYCGSGLHMRKGCGSHTVAVLAGKSGLQRAICTAQSPMHNILHKNSRERRNKQKWMMQKVLEGFKLGHLETPHHFTAEISKIIVQESFRSEVMVNSCQKLLKILLMQNEQGRQGHAYMSCV